MGYVIQVGREKPTKIQAGYVDKKGVPIPSDFIADVIISPGPILVLNRCIVWGKRIKKGSEQGQRVEHNELGYKGDIEFLKWGDPDGYAIDCRYLTRSSSLDVEYQDNIQKIRLVPEDIHIKLVNGENKFDEKKDGLLIRFLMAHPQNRESKSKNPDPEIKGYMFLEVKDEEINLDEVKRAVSTADAVLFVNQLAGNSESAMILFKLIGKHKAFGTTDELSKPNDRYTALIRLAQTDAPTLMGTIEAFKKQISNWFVKAESHRALDISKAGVIGRVEDGKTKLAFSAEGKGKEMIDWVLENCFDPEVNKQLATFKNFVDNLK